MPGASNYFKGGIVSYTNEVKENILKVSHEGLEEQTAVCEEVAREMVLGAIDALKVDFAISATGVAGPTGGTAQITVGTNLVGFCSKDEVGAPQPSQGYGRDIKLPISPQFAPHAMYNLPQGYAKDLEKKSENKVCKV